MVMEQQHNYLVYRGAFCRGDRLRARRTLAAGEGAYEVEAPCNWFWISVDETPEGNKKLLRDGADWCERPVGSTRCSIRFRPCLPESDSAVLSPLRGRRRWRNLEFRRGVTNCASSDKRTCDARKVSLTLSKQV